jgi:hypothetical protein
MNSSPILAGRRTTPLRARSHASALAGSEWEKKGLRFGGPLLVDEFLAQSGDRRFEASDLRHLIVGQCPDLVTNAAQILDLGGQIAGGDRQ